MEAEEEPAGRHPEGPVAFASHVTRDAMAEEAFLTRQLELVAAEGAHSEARREEKLTKLARERDEAATARAAGEEEDAGLLSLVRGVGQVCTGPAAAAATMPSLRLDEQGVVKATRNATVHLRFQPREDTLLLAAADKDGHVSLWHVDRHESSPTDGVFMFAPHRQYVSGLAWAEAHDGLLYR